MTSKVSKTVISAPPCKTGQSLITAACTGGDVEPSPSLPRPSPLRGGMLRVGLAFWGQADPDPLETADWAVPIHRIRAAAGEVNGYITAASHEPREREATREKGRRMVAGSSLCVAFSRSLNIDYVSPSSTDSPGRDCRLPRRGERPSRLAWSGWAAGGPQEHGARDLPGALRRIDHRRTRLSRNDRRSRSSGAVTQHQVTPRTRCHHDRDGQTDQPRPPRGPLSRGSASVWVLISHLLSDDWLNVGGQRGVVGAICHRSEVSRNSVRCLNKLVP